MGLYELFDLLEYRIETPVMYDWFHIMFLIIAVLLIVFLVIKFKNPSDKLLNKMILISGIIMIVFEIYKQLVFTYSPENGVLVADYQWYAFPFQFCSVPMYIYVIVPFTKGKVRDAMLSFLASFALFAGLAVMLYPADVFTSMLGISIQTMVHHGLMLIMGSYLVISKAVKINIKNILKGSIVFAVVVLIALLLDVTVIKFIGDETFNMFYISPYFGCHLPVLSIVHDNVPYVVFLLVYILGFVFVAGLIDYIYVGVEKLCSFIKRKIFPNKKVNE